jgi:predicted Zn-dependent protease with MMP-like domain
MTRSFTTAPTVAELESLAERALAAMPPEFLRPIQNLVIHVDEFPDEETERDMELESPFDILGLYRGVALGQKSFGDLPRGPDMIFLYRRPLLDYWCDSGEDLYRLVRHVLIHEIGHHYGLSDADMEAIEAAAD